MSEKHVKLWQELNERQQKTLKAIYEADQAAERYEMGERARKNWDRPPASVWRWLFYATLPFGLSRLKENMREANVIDEGTGSTWSALERRQFIETQTNDEGTAYEGHLGENSPQWYVFVKLTPLGRAVSRAGDPTYQPTRAFSGVLPEAFWQALVMAYQADKQGIPFTHEAWNATWERMSKYKRDNKRYPLVEWRSTSIFITRQGREFYAQSRVLYQELFPHIDSPEVVPEPLPPEHVLLGQALWAKRRARGIGYRDLAEQIGVSSSILSRIENYKVVTDSQAVDKIKRWLQD